MLSGCALGRLLLVAGAGIQRTAALGGFLGSGRPLGGQLVISPLGAHTGGTGAVAMPPDQQHGAGKSQQLDPGRHDHGQKTRRPERGGLVWRWDQLLVAPGCSIQSPSRANSAWPASVISQSSSSPSGS